MLGTVDSSSINKDKSLSEISSYDPPPKKKEGEKPKIFEEKKVTKVKKIKSKKTEEPILKLEDEEPLILEEPHIEKTIQEKKQVSPAARKMADESKIDLREIEGSGKNGLILKEDIMSLMGAKPAPSERKIQHGPEERVKMTRLRLTIAKRLKEHKKMRQCTTFNEVDERSSK